MGRWLLAITFLIIAVIVAFSIFVATGVIDGPALFWRWGLQIHWLKPHLETYAHGQDAEAWIAQKEEEIRGQAADLDSRAAELQTLQGKLDQRAQQLDKRETDLAAMEAKLQAEQEQRRSVQTLAELYSGMDPADAARILQQLDREIVLDVLLQMDVYDASQILIALPTNLAAALSEQMGRSSN